MRPSFASGGDAKLLAIDAPPGASAESLIKSNPGCIAVMFRGRLLSGQLPPDRQNGEKVHLVIEDDSDLRPAQPERGEFARWRKEEAANAEFPEFRILMSRLRPILPGGLDDLICGTYLKAALARNGGDVEATVRQVTAYFSALRTDRA
jgi:hypothetical protein